MLDTIYELGNDTKFERCLPDTLKQEGGFSNDKHDPGGATMDGIIQREYDSFRRRNDLPLQSVRHISGDEMRTIYFNEYWLPHCPVLVPGLDLSFFDQAVNEGQHEAVILLQRSLAIHADGVWGAQTDDAVIGAERIPRQLIINYSNHRANFYRGLKNFRFFGADWLRRTNEIEAQSLAMVGKTGSANV